MLINNWRHMERLKEVLNYFYFEGGIKMYYTEEERKKIIRTLSKSQRDALHVFSKLSKQSYFANVLASYKGTKRFIFDGYIDHGGVKKGVTCLCGKSLRYEFILKDIKNGQKISLGRTHFQKELGIPDHIARQVHNGILQINLELDEILDKLWRNDTKLPQSLMKHKKKIEFNEEVECLLDAKLPLLRRHIDYLFDATKKFRQHSMKKEEEEVLCKEFQEVLSGKVPYEKFIGELYGDSIEEYLKQSFQYEHISTIIEHLIKTKGLKSQMLYGQHALHKYFSWYIEGNPNYIRHRDYYNEYKHITKISEKEKAERERAQTRAQASAKRWADRLSASRSNSISSKSF